MRFVITLLPGLLSDWRFPLQNTPSYDELDPSWQALKKVMTDPEFQKVLQEIGGLRSSERVQALFTQLTPQALEARGIQFPAGFSITTSVSWHRADPTVGTTDVAATGQNTAEKYVPEIEARVCNGIVIPWTNICIDIPIPPPPPFADGE
jgi:hypothetical protein